MNPFGFDPSRFDPGKMDPKLLMELSNIMRGLPPAQLSRMQTLMHNMMAGFDVRAELEEFEKSLPPGFRERLFSVFMQAGAEPAQPSASERISERNEMSVREARLTLLRAVARGELAPEEAVGLLFGPEA